jgi:hypothetical protein
VIQNEGRMLQVAKCAQCGIGFLAQQPDSDLHIDDVLGAKPRDGCRANVVDAECECAEIAPQRGRELPEFVLPAGTILNDVDHGFRFIDLLDDLRSSAKYRASRYLPMVRPAR